MPDSNIQTSGAALRLVPLPLLSRRLLRGDGPSIGAAFGVDIPTSPRTTTRSSDARAVLWLGPDEWLLLAPGDMALPDWDAETGAAVDISHRQIGLLLDGAGAAAALAVGCPLDLDVAAFPVGSCKRTVFGKAEITLWRQGTNTFQIEVWRSFAAYVSELLDSGIKDVGILSSGADLTLGALGGRLQ